jgi:adenosylhomocysteine nucleosidase
MRPGIIVAMVAEARILAKGPILPGEIIHLPEGAMMLLSGMGAGRARLAARTLLERGITALVSWGAAGGLAPGLSPGSLILPETIIAADQSAYYVDAAWHERLCGRLQGYVEIHKGPLAESTVVVAGCAEKAILFRRTGAIAVDMESASIAVIALEAGLPFMVIRAITDLAEMALPLSALHSIDEFGRVRPLKLIQCLVRNPIQLLALGRLSRNFRAAQATLDTVALHAGSTLLCPSGPSGMTSAARGGPAFPAVAKDTWIDSP